MPQSVPFALRAAGGSCDMISTACHTPCHRARPSRFRAQAETAPSQHCPRRDVPAPAGYMPDLCRSPARHIPVFHSRHNAGSAPPLQVPGHVLLQSPAHPPYTPHTGHSVFYISFPQTGHPFCSLLHGCHARCGQPLWKMEAPSAAPAVGTEGIRNPRLRIHR